MAAKYCVPSELMCQVSKKVKTNLVGIMQRGCTEKSYVPTKKQLFLLVLRNGQKLLDRHLPCSVQEASMDSWQTLQMTNSLLKSDMSNRSAV